MFSKEKKKIEFASLLFVSFCFFLFLFFYICVCFCLVERTEWRRRKLGRERIFFVWGEWDFGCYTFSIWLPFSPKKEERRKKKKKKNWSSYLRLSSNFYQMVRPDFKSIISSVYVLLTICTQLLYNFKSLISTRNSRRLFWLSVQIKKREESRKKREKRTTQIDLFFFVWTLGGKKKTFKVWFTSLPSSLSPTHPPICGVKEIKTCSVR